MHSSSVFLDRLAFSLLLVSLCSIAGLVACGSDTTNSNESAGGKPGVTTAGGAGNSTAQGGSATTGNGGATVTGQGGTTTTTTSTATATGGATTVTGCGTKNNDPFNCKFAWGAPSNGSNQSYLNFVSTWIGDETNGGLGSWAATASNSGASSQSACGDCALVESVAKTNSMVVFYTYFIGFQACKQAGYCDCNTSSGTTLCTNGAAWIKANRAQIIQAYGQYAKAVYAKSPNKPVIWWLEGDFVQYTYSQQTSPLSYAEAGKLARDITCAIKSNQPNAVVAMNHSPWLASDVSIGFWAAQPKDVLDLVWVQGPGDSDTFVNSGDWNVTSANYAWLHQVTGLKIMAETSFGSPDRWTTTTAANVDARIANGVIGVHVNTTPSNYQTSIQGFASLSSTCNRATDTCRCGLLHRIPGAVEAKAPCP